MELISAKKHLQLLALKCSICENMFPTYRIALYDTPKAPPIQRDYSATFNQSIQKSENSGKHYYISRSPSKSPHRKERKSPSNRGLSPPYPLRTIKSDTLPIPKIKEQSEKEYICLVCLQNQNKEKIPRAYRETYYEMGSKLIEKLPVPIYQYAQQCMKAADRLQQKFELMIKAAIKRIQEQKFVIYKLCSDIKKYCENYIEKVKYFEQFNIEQWRTLNKDNKMKKNIYENISLNQSSALNRIIEKLNSLKTISTKIDTFKLQLPDIAAHLAEESKISKEKFTLCNIPITSIINVKGRNFYGIADGRIIYDSIKGYSTNHEHESLIRSFSYDNQYVLYTGSDDLTIKAWDLHKDQIQCIRTFAKFEENRSYHRNIGIIRKGEALVSTRGQFDEYRIRIWELGNEYSNIGCMSGHQSFIRDMITLENDRIITVSDDKTVRMWDTKKHTQVACLQTLSKLTAIVANQSIDLCAVVDEENRIKILDISSNLMVINCWPITRKVNVLKTTNNVECYLIVGTILNITLWDWQGNKLTTIDMDATFAPSCLTSIADKLIVTDGGGNIIKFKVPLLQEIANKPGLVPRYPNI